jgi:hypothetical protein
MKTIITLALLAITAGASAQGKQFYSVTLTSGAIFPVGTLNNRINNGYNFGLDFELSNRSFAVYLNSRINFTNEDPGIELFFYGNNTEKRSYNIVELNAGPRFFIGDKKELHVNIDLGFGLYSGSYLKKMLWGPQVGIGFNYSVTSKLAIVLNSRLNLIGFDEGLPYIGLHSGLKYCLN